MIEGHGDDTYRYADIKIDFSSNICVHGSHQALMTHLASHPELIGHYPEPEAWSLEAMIAERLKIKPEEVIVTNGATEAIYLIAQTFGMHPVIPTPTFSEYEDACNMFNGQFCGSASAEPSSLELCRALANSPKAMVNGQCCWLCNPNNPTGEVYDQLYIDRMMAEFNLVVLDHSYEDYTDKHVMSARWGCQLPSSVQIHSMTKTYGVPGLRLGYITGHESLTRQIRRHMHPWSVSSLAIEAGKFLLQHDELICKPDLNEARRLQDLMQQSGDIIVTPSDTNFFLCKMLHYRAADLKEYLAQEHHILIRDASNFKGLTPNHFRVASQKREENDALVNAINQFFKSGNG